MNKKEKKYSKKKKKYSEKFKMAACGMRHRETTFLFLLAAPISHEQCVTTHINQLISINLCAIFSHFLKLVAVGFSDFPSV